MGGVKLGGIYAGPDSELIVRGTAVVNTLFIVFGDQAQTSNTDLHDLFGGTTYVRAGGITTNFNSTASTAVATFNLGGTACATAPILAASAPYTSTVNMNVTNSSSGLLATIKAANASGGAVNITLAGNMVGTGGFIKTGPGVLTLSGTNTYAGVTNVSAGTLALTQAASLPLAATNLLVSSGATVVANNVGPAYTLIDNAFNSQGVALASIIASPIAQLAGGGGSSVPEPASLGLLGIGAVGLLGRRRRSGGR